MIRGIFFFFVLVAAFGGLIHLWNMLNGKGKWKLIKLLGYATILSLLALTAAAFIVYIF